MAELASSPRRGSLTVVGSGIGLPHLTKETLAWIKRSDKVLYCIADAATERFIQSINKDCENLYGYYADDKPRTDTYREMSDRIVDCVRSGMRVCLVFYGHPGVFVNPSYQAIDILRKEGYEAKMLPAISALDCLFADLEFDPFTGCQMFEATDLLIRARPIDIHSAAVIWQIGCVGDPGFKFKGYDARHFPILVEYLLRFYPPEHKAVIYEASQFSFCKPVIAETTIRGLPECRVTGISTLFIPAVARRNLDMAMVTRLGLKLRAPAAKLAV